MAPDEARALADTGVPLWVFHGAADTVVRAERVRRMIETIRQAGGDPRHTEYPDLGHQIVEQVYGDREFIDWVLSQRRSAR